MYMKRVLGNIKLPLPLNFTFNWEDQNKGFREYYTPTPVKLYIQLGRSKQGF